MKVNDNNKEQYLNFPTHQFDHQVEIDDTTYTSLEVLKSYKVNLKKREFLIAMFCECELSDITTDPYLGKLGKYDSKPYVITKIDNTTITISSLQRTILKFTDKLTITNKDLKNISTPTETTIGRYIINYLLLVDPFEDIIPYMNTQIKPSNIEDIVANYIIGDKIDRNTLDTYLDNVYFIGHFTELCVPSFSDKSITTSPEVKKRREELLEKHKDELDDPVIMSKIEDELIQLDKEYLKDDSSYGFYSSSGKAFNVCRKRMYCTGGMFDTFERESGYDMVNTPLDEGWQEEDFPVLCNDIRRGIYNRAKNTAKGGEGTKFMCRIFQDSAITEKDCGTKKGVTVYLTETNKTNYIYRNIITDRGIVTLTPDTIDQYVNKSIKVRSPLYCKTKNGYCARCMNKILEETDTEALGLIAVNITSAMLQTSLKSMHGSKSEYNNITSLNSFVL
jgi:hypothetical protein